MVKLLAQGAPEIIISSVNVPRFSHEQGIFSTKAAHASQVRSPAVRPITPPTVPPRGFRAEEPKDVHPIAGMNASLHRRGPQQHSPHGGDGPVTVVAGGRGSALASTTRSGVNILSPPSRAGPAAALPMGKERSLSPARDRDGGGHGGGRGGYGGSGVGGGSTSYAAAIAEADAFVQSGFSSSGAQHSMMMAAAYAHTCDAPNNVSVESGVVGRGSPSKHGGGSRLPAGFPAHTSHAADGDARHHQQMPPPPPPPSQQQQRGGRVGSAGHTPAAVNPAAVLARANAAAAEAPTNPLDMPMLWPQPPRGLATAVPQAHGPAPPPAALPLPPPHNRAVASALAASAAATARANGTSSATFGDPGGNPLAPSVRSYVTYGGGRFTSRRLAAMTRVQRREAAVQKASAGGGGGGGGPLDASDGGGSMPNTGGGAPSNSRAGSAQRALGRPAAGAAGEAPGEELLDHNGYNLNVGRKPVAPGRQPVYQLEPIPTDGSTPAADPAALSTIFGGGRSPRVGGGTGGGGGGGGTGGGGGGKQLLLSMPLGVGGGGAAAKAKGTGKQARGTGRLRAVQPPRSDAARSARETAVEESWWLWQGGAGSRVSADTRLRPSSSGSSRTSTFFASGSLRPGTAE